jgi:hypothetical protein
MWEKLSREQKPALFGMLITKGRRGASIAFDQQLKTTLSSLDRFLFPSSIS